MRNLFENRDRTLQHPGKILMILAFVLLIAGCSKNIDSSNTLTFWSSSNPEEIAFAQDYINQWNTVHTDHQIQFQPVPEGQSSEEIILAAVVGKTTPDMYANMWQGDVEDYARAGVIVPLDTLDGFLDFIESRCSREVIEEITSEDGHIYQVPWKVNPIMMIYNTGIFRSRGIDTVPVTYQDFLRAAEKIIEDRDGDGYIDRWMGTTEVSAIWWQRFFNFLPLYLAASGGAPLVKNGKAAFDNKHGIAVFAFLQEVYRRGYFPKEQMKGQRDIFIAQRVAMKFTGPWAIANIERFKSDNLEYDFHQVPVPEYLDGPAYTYCDPKNIIIFSTCKNPEVAWQFLQTMLTAEADLEFLKLSQQLPRRKDLLSNPIFASYFETTPKMKPFAQQANYLRGMDSSPNLKEVLDLISQEYEACVVYGKKSPEEAIQDAAKAVNLLYLK